MNRELQPVPDSLEPKDEERTRPVGQTGGSPDRKARRVAASLLSFDLNAEIERLHDEGTWSREDRNSKVLVKEKELRVVLMALKAGARLDRHHADGRLTIQTIQGQVRLELDDQTVDLADGHVVALERAIPHAVEALTESAVLLTLVWTGHN